MSAVGVLVRTAMWLVLAPACLLLGSGCAGGTRGAGGESAAGGVLGAGVRSGAWASDAELAWLRRLGAWDARLVAGLRRVAQIESSPRLVRKLLAHDGATVLAHNRALAVAGTCSADLRSAVGTPPSERLRSTLAAFDRACTHLERFHNAITLAVFRGEDHLLRQARTEAKLGGELLLRADEGLPPGEVRRLPVVAGDSSRSRTEPRFGRVASWLAGKQVEVRCWSRADWLRLLREEKAYTKHRIDEDTLGFAAIEGTRVNLAPDVCDALVDLAYHHARPKSALAQFPLAAAVVTLAHEPQHSKGVGVEAQAECYAIQLAAATAEHLGVDGRDAHALGALYWQHYDEELPAYSSPECRDGGAYDLRPATSAWP
jgi:hypothetical protein